MTAAVQKLAKTIETLPPDEQTGLYPWLDVRQAKGWDSQIKTDSTSGRLDYLIEEARTDYHAGRCRPLDDLVNDQP
jgi:hypothetical protein